jgi:hypothetical protein
MSEDHRQQGATYLVLDSPGKAEHLLVEVRQVRLEPGELLVVEVVVPRAEVRPAVLATLAEAVARRAARLVERLYNPHHRSPASAPPPSPSSKASSKTDSGSE